jgi:KaiC/GvpD/RAD55 family RecA-like ATPase
LDLDKLFVAACLREGREAIRVAIQKGVTADLLQGEGQKAWRFVLEYVKAYADAPTADMVKGKTDVALEEPPPAPAAFFADEVLNRRLHREIGSQLTAVLAHYESHDPIAAYAAYEEGLRKLRGLQIGSAKTISLPSLAPEFLIYYDRLKNGETGILTPWPSVNESTLGFWPEDFVLYVARLGVGKTWSLVILADHAWAVEKKRVLFATTEMSRIKILQRWVAVRHKLSYNELRSGRLGEFAERKMREGLAETLEAEGLNIIGGDFDFRIESLEAAIEECEPDIVFVDGAYLLRVSGDGRIERAANSFDELKRVAKRNEIPLVASTQFNREAKSHKASSLGADKIAMSDAAGWNADLIFGLMQTDDMKLDNRMIQKPLKFREGVGEDVEVNWNFETMDFSEVGKPGTGGFGKPKAPAAKPDPYGAGSLSFDDDEVPF